MRFYAVRCETGSRRNFSDVPSAGETCTAQARAVKAKQAEKAAKEREKAKALRAKAAAAAKRVAKRVAKATA